MLFPDTASSCAKENAIRCQARGRVPLLLIGALFAVLGMSNTCVAASSPWPGDAAAAETASCPGADLMTRGYLTTAGHVGVVDTASLELGDTSITGIKLPIFIYAAPNGGTIYVDDWATSEVHFVDTCTGAVTNSVYIGGFNQGVLSTDGTTLYEYPLLSTKVSVIDTKTATVVRTLNVTPAVSAALSPDGHKLLIASFFGVSIFDATTGQLMSHTNVDPVPAWMAVTPDGKKFYTANIDGTVSVGDARSAKLITTIPIGKADAPLWVAISPDGSQAWVALGSGGVAVISTETDEIRTTVPTSGIAVGVDFDSAGHAFVSDGGPQSKEMNGLFAILLASLGTWANTPGRILVVDTASFELVKVIATPGMPGSIAIPQGTTRHRKWH